MNETTLEQIKKVYSKTPRDWHEQEMKWTEKLLGKMPLRRNDDCDYFRGRGVTRLCEAGEFTMALPVFQALGNDIRKSMLKREVFMNACYTGNVQLAKQTVDAGYIPNRKDDIEFVLGAVILKGLLDMTKWISKDLLKLDLRLGIAGERYTFFDSACKHGKLPVANWLAAEAKLELADIQDAQTGEIQSLEDASWNGHVEVVQWLVTDFKIDGKKHTRAVCTALQYACRRGHAQLARWILETLKPSKEDVLDYARPNVILNTLYDDRNLDMVKWFIQHFDPPIQDKAIQEWLCGK